MAFIGGCNCGNVRYKLDGEPTRVGLCHCETCRKETGSAYSYFGVWPKDNATVTGKTGCWSSKAGDRHFCTDCGSAIFCVEDASDEIEFRLGTLDQPPSPLKPEYELWTIRREQWLVHLSDSEQHERDRS